MSEDQNNNVTLLLNEWHKNGDKTSFDQLVTQIYQELQQIASIQLNRDHNASICSSELVSEAYFKLIDTKNISFKNRAHFYSIASKTMRRVLVERYRKRNSQKRGANQTLLTFQDDSLSKTNESLDFEKLNEALEQLELLDARQAEIVTLKFFGGLKHDEIAGILDISASTVKREWSMARVWIFNQIKKNDPFYS